MKDFWEKRYNEPDYAYGKEPNVFFKQQLDTLTPGKILLPAEGEGRNAVYAAQMGWEVYAYDFSINAYKKACALAKEKNVEIKYQIASLSEVDYKKNFFDAIALIYVHFPDIVRTQNHQKLSGFLKKGGAVILEAFSSNHLHYQKLNPNVGGPKLLTQLYTKEKLCEDFHGFQLLNPIEEEITLEEGNYHRGTTKVMRMRALK